MKNTKTYTIDEAQVVLEKYCSYQERCHKDVENKLYQLNLITEAKEKIIIHLIENNFLNEERFAKTYVRGKFYIKNWGRIKIKSHLKSKGISTYNINSGLQEINETEYEKSLETLAVKKIKLLKEKDKYKLKGKLITYLTSKGFETNLIYTQIYKLLDI